MKPPTCARAGARLGAAVLTAALCAGLPASAPASAADPVAGGLSSGDSLFPHQGNSGYDALHYDIDLRVDVDVSSTPDAVASTSFPRASSTMQARTTGRPLSSFALDFQGRRLVVDSVVVDGQPATFTRREVTATRDATRDVHKLVVTPARPVSGRFTTVVRYSGTPVSHTDADGSSEGWNNTTDGATFVNEPVGAMTAFPHNDTPSDKATYDVTLDVPSRLTSSSASSPGPRPAAAVSNGELLSRTPSSSGRRTTWAWHQSEQMASDLLLISIGRYDVYESDLELAGGRTLHDWSFLDPSIGADDTAVSLATRDRLTAYLDFLASRYGPYPGNSTGIVVDVVPDSINYALETQDRSFFPSSARPVETVHETMHQWFGDNVSPRDWNDLWFNEGPATYAQALYAHATGTSALTTETHYYRLWKKTSATSATWKVAPAAMTEAAQLFGPQVYQRGAMTLEALRTSIGADAFARLMRQWQQRHGGTSRSTSAFVDLAEEIAGRDLGAFFGAWLYDREKPDWPARFDLRLRGVPATDPVRPGDTVTYRLSTTNTGKVVQRGSVVRLGLSDVLDDARLDRDALPPRVRAVGTTLVWAVPKTRVDDVARVSVPVVVRPDASGATLRARVRAATLGSTCRGCTLTRSVS